MLTEKGRNYFYISEQLQKALKFSGPAVAFHEFRKKVHPHDKILYDSYIKALKSDTSAEHETASGVKNPDELPKTLQLRILSADGEFHWYLYRYRTAYMPGVNSMTGGALIDITETKQRDIKSEKLAFTDSVTDIPNRNRLLDLGRELYNAAKEMGLSYWVMFISIDKFDIINDVHGQIHADELLKDFAKILGRYTNQGGFAARIGGDDFALIIKDSGTPELPVQIAEKIQKEFSLLSSGIFSRSPLSCSAGYAPMPGNAESFTDALGHAQLALNAAGTLRRSNVSSYEKSMPDIMINGKKTGNSLEKAIDLRDLAVYYQPKIDLRTGAAVGAEALVRWILPGGRQVPPADIIGIAENSRLTDKLTRFVLDEACRHNKLWQTLRLPRLVVSVNLTSFDFFKDITRTVSETVFKSGITPGYLEIELPESLAMRDMELTVQNMAALRKFGIGIALDDFGTGYSSLSFIRALPLTALKLDRSFICKLGKDETAREIISAVIRIAASKNITTVAVGVETAQQANLLKEMGCSQAQGFFFGKPVPSSEFIKQMSGHSRS
jgi:diguanylate cyclase (GGDEF)-like protein